MRRGCISLGNIRCHGCQRNILYADRYLLIEEEDEAEVESGQKSYYCVDCCLQRGYARYREEKGELVLTFFPSELQSPQPDSDEAASDEIKDNE